MFKPVFSPTGNQVTVYVEGEPHKVSEGISVSAALLQLGKESAYITAKKHQERGPFCLMGVCFECLMEIDGVPNQQGCLTPVREGMQIKMQRGIPSFTPQEK